ncbi:MAG: UvrD-helicase domain-containing protein [Actinomycetota bacterium]|nr:UvrD-helicase domain-containing protein [Actinomycetota bacterium]
MSSAAPLRADHLADAADRERVARDLGATLFVEAGAGTGKTRALVERVLSLVRSGCPLSSIAAITFTEAAAGELRVRIRSRLLELAAGDPGDPLVLGALDDLDEAAITTIHGFAQRLLAEDPLAAGLPLRSEVLDEVRADLAFEERFAGFLDALFGDETAHETVRGALALGITVANVRGLARQMDERWHLRVPAAPPAGAVAEAARRFASAVREQLQAVLALVGCCADEQDRLLEAIGRLGEAPAIHPGGDWVDELAWLSALEVARPGQLGRKAAWQGCGVDEARAALGALGELRSEALAHLADLVLADLLARLQGWSAAQAAERRRAGTLVFHDLLVWCRDLLRDRPDRRRAARARYVRVLVDEFQDTDELQYEILQLLAAAPGASEADPGRLFFVGDPKQAIYRFRGADVALYERARLELAGAPSRLVTNFRSVPGVLSYVNEVFGTLFSAQRDGQRAGGALGLVAARPAADGAAVHLIGGPLELPASERREEEARLVADAIARVVEEGWSIGSGPDARPARFGDIALLVTRRTGLGELESALEAAQIPYRLASASLVFAAEEVRDLLACLRAVAHPGDERAVVAALRSAAFGIDDAALLVYRQAGGRFRAGATAPIVPGAEAVQQALDRLAEWFARSRGRPALEVLEDVLASTHLFELYALADQREDAWRRLEATRAAAVEFRLADGGGVREFVDWMERRAMSRAADVAVLEDDEDAVVVLTMHAAKGLEFPVVVLGELGARPRPAAGPTLLRHGGGHLEARVRDGLATAGFAAALAEEQRALRDEQLRLAYVGATRARDHLIVSLVHQPAASAASASLAEVIAACGPTGGASEVLAPRLARRRHPAPPLEADTSSTSGLAAYEAWMARRRSLLARLGRAVRINPSELAEGGASRPAGRREELTAVGRAVHQVLERVELPNAGDLDELSTAFAVAHGCPDAAGMVASLAAAALASPIVREAATSASLRRELPFTLPSQGALIDGVVDLCFVTPAGLVVVDYKTEALTGEVATAAVIERARAQLGAYVLALEAALGCAVARAVLVILTPPANALEHELGDLGSARATATAAITARARAAAGERLAPSWP